MPIPAAKRNTASRLALLYERVRRPDLALPQRQGIDWSKIDAPALLDEAALALPDDRIAIWQRLTEIRPEDRATWEKLLAVLEGPGFRRLAGTLLSGELSDPMRADLRERVFVSWQRELEGDLRRGDLRSGAPQGSRPGPRRLAGSSTDVAALVRGIGPGAVRAHR